MQAGLFICLFFSFSLLFLVDVFIALLSQLYQGIKCICHRSWVPVALAVSPFPSRPHVVQHPWSCPWGINTSSWVVLGLSNCPFFPAFHPAGPFHSCFMWHRRTPGSSSLLWVSGAPCAPHCHSEPWDTQRQQLRDIPTHPLPTLASSCPKPSAFLQQLMQGCPRIPFHSCQQRSSEPKRKHQAYRGCSHSAGFGSRGWTCSSWSDWKFWLTRCFFLWRFVLAWELLGWKITTAFKLFYSFH